MSDALTLFLRLEGPLQSWGDPSKFVMRRTMDAPTKSGVLGLICCAMGLSRGRVAQDPIPDESLRQLAKHLVPRREGHKDEPRRAALDVLNTLCMAVRVDRPGTRWWDYHTVGAGTGLTTAGDGVKAGAQGTLITRREYLADASFLVALRGDAALVDKVKAALLSPQWSFYLGRRSCLPSAPVFLQPRSGDTWTNPMSLGGDLMASLRAVPWCPRYAMDPPPQVLPCLIEWRRTDHDDIVPVEAEVWYDVPFSFEPPVHHPRLVVRAQMSRLAVGPALQLRTAAPPRPRADYTDTEYRRRRQERIESDHGLCVFCKSPASTVQHVTYRRAGGDETQDDLRSLCRLCHDAVTMIEYGLGMGLDRINPEDPQYRDVIIQKRQEIIAFRSLETRRRRLEPEDVE